MALRTTVTYIGDPEATKKAVRAAVNVALEEVAAYWHSRILPRHFTTAATALYRYAARSARWRAHKRRVTGEHVPLVYRGQLRRDVSGRDIRVRGKSVTVRMSGPRYLTMRPRPKTVGMSEGPPPKTRADEVLANRTAELKLLAKIFNTRVQRELQNVRATRTETRG